MSIQDWIKWLDPITERLTVPTAWIRPLISGAFGFKVKEREGRPGGWGSRISFGKAENEELFYNGIFYFRIMFPFFVGLHFRWAGRDPTRREFLQTYIGWKLNGHFSAVFRIQSDSSAMAGTYKPNPGQAVGWEDGGK